MPTPPEGMHDWARGVCRRCGMGRDDMWDAGRQHEQCPGKPPANSPGKDEAT